MIALRVPLCSHGNTCKIIWGFLAVKSLGHKEVIRRAVVNRLFSQPPFSYGTEHPRPTLCMSSTESLRFSTFQLLFVSPREHRCLRPQRCLEQKLCFAIKPNVVFISCLVPSWSVSTCLLCLHYQLHFSWVPEHARLRFVLPFCSPPFLAHGVQCTSDFPYPFFGLTLFLAWLLTAPAFLLLEQCSATLCKCSSFPRVTHAT